MLACDARAARDEVLAARAGGMSNLEIYRSVLHPALTRIGTMWEMGEATIAQEHFCTAATHRAMAELQVTSPARTRTGRRIVAAAVDGEQHEIGVRMVADLFELEGWDAYYFGADTPGFALLASVATIQPQVVAISVTMAENAPRAADTIRSIRAQHGANVLLIAGGHAFNAGLLTLDDVPADACAADAGEALELANAALSLRDESPHA